VAGVRRNSLLSSVLPLQDIAFHLLVLLFAAAFIAGFIDSIAGGGGLITIPAMLIVGIPPLESLATNKLQGQFGVASATFAYARRGHVDLRKQFPMAAAAVVGGVLGALLALVVPAHYLAAAIPFLLVGIGLFFFGLIVVPLIGLYDGVFGPGAGSFYMLAFVLLGGFGLLKATAHTKLLNLGSNFGSFLVFAVSGSIMWKVGLIMGAGQVLGAQIGSRVAMQSGAKVIKPLLVISCLALATKLLSDPSHPVRIWLGL
jgi:uncharacterized membrane protein YfcA